jgi:hypothetical protein
MFQKFILNSDLIKSNLNPNTVHLASKEVTDLIFAVSANSTCLPFKMRHLCEQHKKFIDRNHLEHRVLLTHGKACVGFSALLRSTSIHVFHISLQQGILRAFSLLHHELCSRIKEKSLRPVNLIFHCKKLVGILKKEKSPTTPTLFE